MATERLDILVNERGARVVSRNIERVGSSAIKSEGNVNLLRTALVAVGGTLVIRKMIQLSDTFTRIRNRLKIVTNGTKELNRVFDSLADIAVRTRSSLEQTSELYARISLSTKELGLTSSEVLSIVETLNKAVVTSGATAAEASGSIRQLTQAFARGQLRGQELNSVLEQMPIIATSIEKTLGITRGELLKMAEEGKITSKVMIQAFKEASESIDKGFGKAIPTVEQALEVLNTKLIIAVGELGEATGVAEGLSTSIILLSNSINILVKGFAVLSIALATGLVLAKSRKTIAIELAVANLALAESEVAVATAYLTEQRTAALLTGSLTRLTSAKAGVVAANARLTVSSEALSAAQATQVGIFGRVAAGIKGIGIAIVSNPIGAIIAVVVAIISALVIFRKDIKLTKDGIVTLESVFVLAGRGLRKFADALLNAVPDSIKIGIKGAIQIFKELDLSVEATLIGVAKFADTIIKIFQFIFSAIKAISKNISITIKNSFITAFRAVLRLVEIEGNKIIDKLNAINPFDQIERLKIEVDTSELEKTKDISLELGKLFLDTFDPEKMGPFEFVTKEIFKELRKVGKELEAAQQKADAFKRKRDPAAESSLESLRADIGVSGGTQLDAIRKESFDRFALAQKFRDDEIISLKEHETLKTQIFEKATRDRAEFQQKSAALVLSNVSNGFAQLAQIAEAAGGKQSASFRVLFALSKAFAIAETIISTQVASARALAELGPIAGASLAAAIEFNGAAKVGLIAATAFAGFKDGGLVTGPGGPRDDRIPAMLSNKEFVVNASATRNNRALLESINSGVRPTSQAGGGRISSLPMAQASGPKVSVNIINVAGVDVAVETTEEDDETKLDIFITKVDESLAANFSQGKGKLTEQIKQGQERDF